MRKMLMVCYKAQDTPIPYWPLILEDLLVMWPRFA